MDITEIKISQKALKESEQKYRTMIENVNEAIYIHDFKGNIIDVNENACKMVGYGREELIGSNLSIIDSPENAEFLPERMEVLLSRDSLIFEGEHIGKDGTAVPVEVSARVVHRQGEGQIQGFVRDVTERKRAEAEMQKSERLESIGVLAGGIAHDFNNILSGVLGNISLAKLEDERGEDVIYLLEEAEQAALRARDLTNQLLTFSKGGEPIRKTASFSGLVRESAGFVLRGSNVKCVASFPEDLWMVDIDESQIGQVLNNLLINADHAMPYGGVVSVKAENVRVGREESASLRPGDYIKVMVSDSGQGIPEEYLPRIFDPYFTTKAKGSGLGLATSYSIVKQHDGDVSVESELGKGTTFTFYLPAVPGKKIPPPEAPTPKAGRGKGRVLVIDDEEILLAIISRMLESLGYGSRTAQDGARGVALYRKAMEKGEPFNAVITDLTIPGGMGGLEVAKNLREIDPSAKIIIASGYSNDPVMAQFKEHGFKGFVKKPFRIDELAKALDDLAP